MFCNSSGVRISFLSEDLVMPKAGPHSDLLIIFVVATTFGELQFWLFIFWRFDFARFGSINVDISLCLFARRSDQRHGNDLRKNVDFSKKVIDGVLSGLFFFIDDVWC